MSASALIILYRMCGRRIINSIKHADFEDYLRFVVYIFLIAVFWIGSYLFFKRGFRVVNYIQPIGPILIARFLSIFFIALSIMALIGTAFASYSRLYSSKDLLMLNASPTRSRDIFSYQLFHTLNAGMSMILCLAIPVYFAYGKVGMAKPYFYPIAILSSVFMMIIYGSIGIFLMLLIAGFIIDKKNLWKNLFLINISIDIIYLLVRYLWM